MNDQQQEEEEGSVCPAGPVAVPLITVSAVVRFHSQEFSIYLPNCPCLSTVFTRPLKALKVKGEPGLLLSAFASHPSVLCSTRAGTGAHP